MKYLEACVHLLHHRIITLKVACQGHAQFRNLPVLFIGEHLLTGSCRFSFSPPQKGRASCRKNPGRLTRQLPYKVRDE